MQTGSTLPCKWQGLLKALPVHWSLSLRMAVNEELWGVVAWELPMGEDPFCFLRLLVIFSWRTLDFAGLPRTSPYDLLRPAGLSGVQRLQNMVSWSTGMGWGWYLLSQVGLFLLSSPPMFQRVMAQDCWRHGVVQTRGKICCSIWYSNVEHQWGISKPRAVTCWISWVRQTYFARPPPYWAQSGSLAVLKPRWINQWLPKMISWLRNKTCWKGTETNRVTEAAPGSSTLRTENRCLAAREIRKFSSSSWKNQDGSTTNW
jgi:hypothetical protein